MVFDGVAFNCLGHSPAPTKKTRALSCDHGTTSMGIQMQGALQGGGGGLNPNAAHRKIRHHHEKKRCLQVVVGVACRLPWVSTSALPHKAAIVFAPTKKI